MAKEITFYGIERELKLNATNVRTALKSSKIINQTTLNLITKKAKEINRRNKNFGYSLANKSRRNWYCGT